MSPFALSNIVLPVFPSALGRLLVILQNQQSDIKELCEAIRCDTVLAARVLKLANSASIGLPNRVSSITNAVVLLGRKRIASLVLGLAAVNSVSSPQKPLACELGRYWHHALVCASLCEAIARTIRRSVPIDPDDAFTAGLLHDAGKLALCCSHCAYVQQVVTRAEAEKTTFYAAEDQVITHDKMGELLVTGWQFPLELTRAIGTHHAPSGVLSSLVHVADCMTHGLGFGVFAKECMPNVSDAALACLGLSVERLKVIGAQVLAAQGRIDALMDAVM